MNWQTFLSTLIGVLTGGLISIGALLLKWRLDRRKESEDWFFNRYIEGGLDPLIQFLNEWFTLAAMPSRSPAAALDNAKFDAVPSVAVSRVNDITNDEGLFHWFQAVNAAVKRARAANDVSLTVEITSAVGTEVLQLKQLRTYLLGVTIRSKRDAHQLHSHGAVKSFVRTQRDLVEQFRSGPMRSFTREYRAKPQETPEDVQQGDQAEHQ